MRALWERVGRCVDSFKMVSVRDAIDGAGQLPGLDEVERLASSGRDVDVLTAQTFSE